jgi:hypothetical protein
MSTQSKEYSRNYYRKNREKFLAIAKKYRDENRDKIKEYDKNKRPKESKSKRNAQYWIDHKEQLTDYHKKYQVEREKVDIQYKIKRRLRARLSKLTKGNRPFSSIDALGCSIVDFRNHLESLWQEGMTWENYGDWHIDHIIPCAAFDLTKESEVKKCFHFSNLQPLWEKDNLKKWMKY